MSSQTRHFTEAIKVEQVRLLYKQAPSTLMLGWLAALVATGLLWGIANQQGLLAWITALSALTMLRLGMWYRYSHGEHSNKDQLRWGNRYIVSAGFAGLIWGSLTLLFSTDWPAGYQLIIILLLTGIVAGAVPANSTISLCFLVFMLPISLQVILVLLFQDEIAYQFLALLTLIFSFQMFSSSHKFSDNLVASLQTQFEKQDLAEQLSETNEELKYEIAEHQKAGQSLESANQLLWDSNVLFSQAEQIGNLGHWEWDEIAASFITCSEQYANIYGMTVEQVLSEYSDFKKDLALISPEDRDRYRQVVQMAVELKERWDIEYRFNQPSGKQVYIHEIGEPVLNEQGVLVKTIGTIQDITERKHLEDRLEFLSVHDPLTGLFNRRALEKRLIDEISRANRYEHDLSVFMLDLDFFKNINDSHGHEAGDKVLKELANVLQNTLRVSDYVARYGGEEFVVVLPETPLAKAQELAERVRESIGEHSITIGDDIRLQVTASIGIATFDKDMASWETLIGLADKAMYKAKKAGKNQCQVSGMHDTEHQS